MEGWWAIPYEEILEGLIRVQREALVKCDQYFTACAFAWASGSGKVIDSNGSPIVEAAGLDDLADAAAVAVQAALAKTKEVV